VPRNRVACGHHCVTAYMITIFFCTATRTSNIKEHSRKKCNFHSSVHLECLNYFSAPHFSGKGKGKAIPLQALTGPKGSRRLRLPAISTRRLQGCQPYTPAAFTPRKYSWYSFLLEAESTPGPLCGQKDYVNEKFQ
jgi:hypothetical protein